MSDVNVVVGIKGDDSGGRVIKKTLDDIVVSSDKAVSAAKKLEDQAQKTSNSEKLLAAETQKANAATLAAAAAQSRAENAIRNAGIQASKLAEAEKRLAAETQKTAAAAIAAAAAQKSAENAMKSAELRAAQLEEQNKKFNQTLAETNSFLGKAKALLATYFGLQTIKAIRDAAMAAEALRYRMAAAVGTFGDAGNALKFVHEESERLGLNFKDTAGAFSGFAASALRAGLSMADVKTIFTGTSEAIRALKLNQDQANSVFLALEQMAGKGVVQMQELKLQLGAALPGAIEIFAKAMGKTPAEFYKMVSAGEVTIDKLKVMGQAFHDEFGEAAVNASQSAAAETARFQNALFELSDELGNNTGLMAAYKDTLGGLASFMNSDLTHGAVDVLRLAVFGLRDTFDAVTTFIGTAFDLLVNKLKGDANDIIGLFNSLKETSNNLFNTNLQPTSLYNTVSSSSIVGAGLDHIKTEQDKLNSQYNAITANGISGVKLPDSQGWVTDNGPSKAQQKAAKEALREQTKIQNELTQAIKSSRTEEEKLNDKIAELEKMRPFAKTTEQVDAINRGIKNVQGELEKLRVQAELKGPVGQAFESLAKGIDDGMKKSFEDVFKKSGGGFKGMLEGMKDMFKTFLADLAYMALARPIVISMVGAMGGIMGLSSGAVASALGQTGAASSAGSAASGIGGIGSIFSLGKALLSGGIGTGLGNFAGKASAFLGGSFSQNVAVQKFFTNAGSLGNMVGGFAGGLGANLLGLGSSNGYVNAAAGTIGGLLGSPGGPLGSAAGAFLGTALGGLFGGGKPSDMAQGGTLDFSNGLTTTNGQTGKKYSAANATFRNQVFEETNNILGLLKSYGATIQGSLDLVIGSRDGLRVNGRVFASNDANGMMNAIKELIQAGTTGLSTTLSTILSKLGLGDMNALSNAFQFGQSYDETLNPKTLAMQLADSIKIVNDQFQQLLDTATNLGLPIEEYSKALDKQKDAAIGALKAQAAGFSTLEDMTNTFKAFLDGQALGANSSLNPMDKLGLAQSNFGDLLAKAQGGDLSVTQQLLASADQLLNIGRGVYASSVSFAGLETFVRSSITGIAHAAGVPGYAVGTNSAAKGMALVGERGPELVHFRGGEKVFTASQTSGIMGNMATDNARSNAQMLSVLGEMSDELKASRAENVRMRKVMESLRNQQRVAS